MANRQEAAKQNKQNKAQLEEKATQTEQANNETQSKKAVTIDEKKENMGNNAPAVKTESKNNNVIVCLKHPQGIKFKSSFKTYKFTFLAGIPIGTEA